MGGSCCTESRDDGRTWKRVPSPLDAAHRFGARPPGRQRPPARGAAHLGVSADGTVILAACRMRMVTEGSPEYRGPGIRDRGRGVRARAARGRRVGRAWSCVDARRTTGRVGDHLAARRFPSAAAAGSHPPSAMPSRTCPSGSAAITRSSCSRRTTAAPGPSPVRCSMTRPRTVVYYDQHVAVRSDGRLLSLAWVHDVVDDVTVDARAGWSA